MRATVDGRVVDVGGPKPRLVLARLALGAPSAITSDALIDAVWESHPPATARKTLQGYVSTLRATLGSEAVVTAGAAYALTIPTSCIDVHRFEALLDRAREARAARRPAEAWGLLGEALALWRGRPMAGLEDVAFVAEECRRLDALRLAVLEQQAEVGLELHRHDDVIALVEDLVVSHPLRERLWTALMTALYRAGRQAEALAAYRRLRALLAEELGIEPWGVVQDLHQRILAHDPRLERPPETGVASPAPQQPGNLPQRLTTVVGREQAVERVAGALGAARVVTLVGAGGVGKSTLALEVAAGAAGAFPDGVWLCELAPLSRGEPVPHAVAAALGVQQRHGLGIAETVVEYCQGKRLLLVIDNCEHLVEEAGGLVERIVAMCGGVVVLATSREPLGIGGEQVWPVPPLDLADARGLFVDRATAADPGFSLTGGNAAAVDEICRNLDGLPLAIELAAARVRAMTAQEIAGRLDQRFRLLSGGRRTAVQRHQSLRDAIEWSYGLLDEREQGLLATLSVFAGGFDVPVVRQVCAPDLDELAVTDLVTSLVDKSMVAVDTGRQMSRYRLLETIRAYGRERLEASGAAEGVRRRHAEYFTALAEQAGRGLNGPDEAIWVERLTTDFDNLRAAFEWAVAAGDVELALRLVADLPDFTYWRVGYESATWAEVAIGLADGTAHPLLPTVRADAARGAWMVGDFPRALRLAALAASGYSGGGPRTCHPGDVVADVALYDGRVDEALAHYERETEKARHEGEVTRLAWTLYYVAVCHAVRRSPAAGIPAAEESLALARATGNPSAVAMALYALGLVLKKSDPARALALFDESVAASASVRNRWFGGIALMEAAATRAVHGDPQRAAGAFVEVLERWDRFGDRTQHWLNLRYVARLLDRVGEGEGAAVLHQALVAASKTSPLDETRLTALARQLGPETFAEATARGRAMAGADAVAYARDRLRRLAGKEPGDAASAPLRLVRQPH